MAFKFGFLQDYLYIYFAKKKTFDPGGKNKNIQYFLSFQNKNVRRKIQTRGCRGQGCRYVEAEAIMQKGELKLKLVFFIS